MLGFPFRPRAVRRTGDDSPARSLYRYVWRMSGWHQVRVCVLAAIVASLSMVPLELQRRIINNAVGDQNVRLLLLLGGAYLVFVIVQAAVKYLLRLYQGWLSESAIRYSREHLSKIHDYRKAARDSAAGGRAVSVIGAEVEKVGGFVGEGLPQPVVNLGMVITIIGYMLVVEPLVAAFSLAFILPQAIAVPLIQRYVNRLIEARVVLLRELGEMVSGEGSEEVAEPQGAFRSGLDGIYANRMKIYALKFAMKGFVNLLSALAPLSVLVFGGYMVIQGETTLGVVVAFISGFERLTTPLRELVTFYREAAQADVQHQMIARWM